MRRQFCGVLNKTSKGYILEGNGEDFNLSEELRFFWKNEIVVKISITNNNNYLLSDCGEILYERDSNKKYSLHINNINIEDILNNNLQKLIEVTVDAYRKGFSYEKSNIG